MQFRVLGIVLHAEWKYITEPESLWWTPEDYETKLGSSRLVTSPVLAILWRGVEKACFQQTDSHPLSGHPLDPLQGIKSISAAFR